MSRVYEERNIPAKTEQVLVARVCDLCGRRAAKTAHGIYGDDWESRTFGVDETTISVEIKQRSGSSYPEGGSGTTYSVDLCPDCFQGKLIPWLRSQGAEISEREWD